MNSKRYIYLFGPSKISVYYYDFPFMKKERQASIVIRVIFGACWASGIQGICCRCSSKMTHKKERKCDPQSAGQESQRPGWIAGNVAQSNGSKVSVQFHLKVDFHPGRKSPIGCCFSSCLIPGILIILKDTHIAPRRNNEYLI